MTKYKLVKEYPGHKIGDIAYFEPNICTTNFIWQGKTGSLENIIVPKDFQPDQNNGWFELVIELNYTITGYKYPHSTTIQSVKNKKGVEFFVGQKVKILGKITTIITGFHISEFDTVDMFIVTNQVEIDINCVQDYRFSTFDRIDIYRGEPYYFVVHTWDNDYIILKDFANCPDSGKHPEKYTYFFNKDDAQEFIAEKRRERNDKDDKCVFTLNDVINTPNINLSDTNKLKFRVLASQKEFSIKK